jgi:hypothetical protein
MTFVKFSFKVVSPHKKECSCEGNRPIIPRARLIHHFAITFLLLDYSLAMPTLFTINEF